MTSKLISIAKITVDGPEIGNRELKRVKSIKETSDKDKEVVTVVGSADGAGTKKKPGGGKLSLEVLREEIPEIDWEKAEAEDWVFSVQVEDKKGRIKQWLECEVANAADDSSDDGSNTKTVELVWMKRRMLPKAQ
jgi:hypothetical protein